MKPVSRCSSLADALGTAIKQFGLERKVKEHQIILRWNEIAGQTIANHLTPVRFRDGKLWMKAENAMWRQELSLMRVELMNKLNQAIGMDIIEEIILR